MKVAILKQADGAIQVMHLIPIGVQVDGKDWIVGRILNRNGTMSIMVMREDQCGEITMSADDFANGKEPDGVTFIYSDVATEVAKKSDGSKIASWRHMPNSVIPTDMTFRDAWADETPELTIDIDMNKAREIHKNKIREARAPLLAALDVEYQRADEAGDTAAKKAVAAKKQALRDTTKDARLASATTPDRLKAVWPGAIVTI